ncbi:MAG TPA: hypothetical protein VG389_17170 [Myxococcota bacterium]|jgi:hypothetical protein|nr:hypothetical protein [Myxococcota bacterium]
MRAYAAVAAVLALGAGGCTRMHAFRLDRLTMPILVTASDLSADDYTPVAFLRVSRWRFDPGSAFRADYESPVGFQILNDYLVKKAVDLGADAVVHVRSGYSGGVLFASAWLEGMAVKREGSVAAPAPHPMPPVVIPAPAAPGPSSFAPEPEAVPAPVPVPVLDFAI